MKRSPITRKTPLRAKKPWQRQPTLRETLAALLTIQKAQQVIAWTSKDADHYFSRWIRARDPFCFFGCSRPSTQNSHFWGRGHSATRYDPENCDGVCEWCHAEHEGKKNGVYRTLKIKQLGQERYDALEQRAQSIVKRRDAIIQLMAWLQG